MKSILKITLMLLMLVLFGEKAAARQLTLEEAMARLNANSTNMRKATAMRNLSLVCTKSEAGTNTLYIMNRNNGGMVFLSADDCAPALLGWTDSGAYNEDSIPSSMRWWIEQYSQNIAQASSTGSTLRKIEIDNHTIPALLSTKWGQEWPYYNYCNDIGSQSVTGCVATAMAQLMKYHKWPVKGTGNHSYSYQFINASGDTTKFSISSNFEEHTYDWENMLDEYANYSISDEKQNAVALLMKDCGVSVDMMYLGASSSAATSKIAYALSTYFGYDKSMRNLYRTYYTDDEWTKLMIDELTAKRPVLYNGSSKTDGGHAFICDGYDESGYFHFNWGWSGYCDGFFVVTGDNALWPSAVSSGFTSSQMITIGIKPDEGGELPASLLATSQNFELSTDSVGRTGNFYLSISNFFNAGTYPVTAKLGAKLVGVDNDKTYYLSSMAGSGTYIVGNNYSTTYYLDPSSVMKNGTYRVYPVFQDMSEENPQWQDVLITQDLEIPVIKIGGTEPNFKLASMPYAYCGNRYSPSGKVTKEGLKFHIEIECMHDITDNYIVAYVFPTGGGGLSYSVASASKLVTAKEGEKVTLDVAPGTNSLIVGNLYKVYVYDYNAKIYLSPSDDNPFYITIVDRMPGVSDVSNTIKEATDGTKSLQDIQEAVDEALKLQFIKQ